MVFFVQSYDYTNLINIKRRNIKIKIMYKIRKKFKIKFTKVNEKFEDLKGVIRSPNGKKDIQCNGPWF
jgi:hypothetical protein